VVAVDKVSTTIEKGEIVGLLGHNGAGKTTLMKMLTGFLEPTGGTVTVGGLDVVNDRIGVQRQIGYLPENAPLYPEMLVHEYLVMMAELRGLDADASEKAVADAARQTGIVEYLGRPIATLSKGYRQRVGIAQAIIHGPSLLILDEPIQGLDPVQIVEMRKMIGELRGEHTILLSTHILTEIEATCDRILVMHQGRVQAQGTEEELSSKLSARRTLQLEVRGTADALKAALGGVPGARVLTIEPDGAESVKASLQVEDAQREAVSRAVVQAGLGLHAMYSESTGLEALFLQLSSSAAGSGANAAQSAAARQSANPPSEAHP
jgi:ABC-2 type transport system ATP-binding protein